jgi:hypothetical protein
MSLRHWGFLVIFCGFDLTGRAFRLQIFLAIEATPFRLIAAGPMFPVHPAGAPGPGARGRAGRKKFSAARERTGSRL